MRAAAVPLPARLRKKENFRTRTRTRARTPKVPTRESFMMARRSSTVWPPPNPSTVSARPSRWRPPVSQTVRHNKTPAAAGSGKKRGNPAQTPQKTTPSKPPTQGHQNMDRARAPASAGAVRSQGNLVRKVRARGRVQFIKYCFLFSVLGFGFLVFGQKFLVVAVEADGPLTILPEKSSAYSPFSATPAPRKVAIS